ncbi:MAG: 2-hydroxymuconate tautomerase family protein [Firmicutes bacterium]|nr:2-hydroxymuconate tautomerase family protein [Bacillota bacterium]MDD4694495.1 2-hydroxymuconate tautomerase family protein [Bacillota bacterium]
MPIATIKLLEGRTDTQKKKLVETVTKAIQDAIGASPENITVVLEEMQRTHYAVGGIRASDK